MPAHTPRPHLNKTITIPNKGRAVLLAWAFLCGAFLAPFFLWLGRWVFWCYLLILGGVLGFFFVRCGQFQAVLTAATLRVEYGPWFCGMQHRQAHLPIPCTTYTTPLLRRAGCCVMVSRGAGRRFVFPAIRNADAVFLRAALCAYLAPNIPSPHALVPPTQVQP